MPPSRYSIFVCYRKAHRAFADEVLTTLIATGADAKLDDEYPQTTISHRTQSLGHIQDSHCVVVVLPPDFPEWLPTGLVELNQQRGQDGMPELANEVAAVVDRMTRDVRKPVIVLMMQAPDGSPRIVDLPMYLRDHPNVIECGQANWSRELTRTIAVVGGPSPGTPPRSQDLQLLRSELAAATAEWQYGRSGGVRVGDQGGGAGHGSKFTYEPAFFVPIHGTGRPSDVVAARSQSVPIVDVVDWIAHGDRTDGWLLGNAGAGKTIAMTKAACIAAEEWIEWSRSDAGARRNAAPRIPILLTCQSFYPRPRVEHSDPWCHVTVSRLAQEMAALIGRTWVEFCRLIEEWKCLLLLDAVDDVPDPNATERIEKTIAYLQRIASGLRVVVTTRTRDLRPVPEAAEVMSIAPLSFDRASELVYKIASTRQDAVWRVLQVRNLLRPPTSPDFDVLDNPLGITMACLLAVQPGGRPLRARVGELVDRLLTAVCGDDELTIGRGDLQVCALAAMRKGHNRLPLSQVADVLNARHGLAMGQGALEGHLQKLSGIVHIVRTADEDYLDFVHGSYLNYLTAEAVADWPSDGVFERLRGEVSGWKRVAEFLPGLLARRNRVVDAKGLLQQLVAAAAQSEGDGPAIWLAGLVALVDDDELQRSAEARSFTLAARNAIGGATGVWTDQTRAEVLDACGLAARRYLDELFRLEWLPVEELSARNKRTSVAKAPVIVADYAKFLNDPGNRDPAFWADGVKPAFVHESDDGAWYDQLRTPLRPITRVTWYEARAYCRWLTRTTEGGVVRLPTPAEWKVIALGGQATRAYPWDPGYVRFNHRSTGLRRPSPVGLFPPYCRPGLLDFGANVFEWSQGGADPEPDEEQALGGFYGDYLQHLRIDRQPIYLHRQSRLPDTGFRCLWETRMVV